MYPSQEVVRETSLVGIFITADALQMMVQVIFNFLTMLQDRPMSRYKLGIGQVEERG